MAWTGRTKTRFGWAFAPAGASQAQNANGIRAVTPVRPVNPQTGTDRNRVPNNPQDGEIIESDMEIK